jgi:hypothetical protein
MRTWFNRLALAAAAAVAVPTFTMADVMQHVPADALMVVKVNKLEATSKKLSQFATELGITMFVPQLMDPLAAVKQQLGVTEGINGEGEAAFVFVDPKGGDEENGMLILIPVSDYNAVVGKLGERVIATDGGVTQLKMGGGDEGYLSDWGNGYAALAPKKDTVLNKPAAALKAAGVTGKELTEGDLVLYANVPQLKTALSDHLGEGRTKALKELKTEMAEKPDVAELVPVAEAGVNQLFNALEGFLRDGRASTVSLNFHEKGLKFVVLSEFVEGSYIASAVAATPNTTEPLLVGLPNLKYLGVGGFAGGSPESVKVVEDLVGPVIEAFPKTEKYAWVPKAYSDIRTMMVEIKGGAGGMLTPEGAFGESALLQSVNVMRGDATKIQPLMKSMFDVGNNINAMVPANGGAMMSTTLTDAAKTIDGVNFTLYSTSTSGDSPEAMQVRQGMQMIYGKDVQEQYFGSIDGALLSFMGITDEQADQFVKAAKANAPADLLALNYIQQTTSVMPKSRVLEGLYFVDEIAATGIRAARQFGFLNADLAIPPELPPIGVTVGTRENTIESVVFVPTELLQALISVGVQGAMQQQGGGGGGGL